MSSKSIILYVKPGCPWCHMAEEYLDSHGYKYKRIDVRRHPVAMEELRDLSGQISTPTLVVEDLILPDFGPEQLEDFLKEHNILP